MQPSQPWTWPSTGAIILANLFPKHGNSLSHVSTLIDEFLVGSLDDRVLRTACEFGASPSDLEFVLSRSTPDWSQVVKAAARGGYLHVFQWMTDRQDSRGPWEADFSFYALQEAACYGHLEIIKWIHEHGLDSITVCALSEAIYHGHLPVVKWLLQEGVQLTDYDQQQLRQAAENGHLDTVQWIHENFKDADTSYAMAGAARSGDLDLLQWLHQLKSCPEACDTIVLDAAVGGGHFLVVEWLFENCSKGCTGNAVGGAAFAGNIPMLQWLHRHYSDRFDANLMSAAAVNGQLAALKWLHGHCSEGFLSHAINSAAYEGHVEVVRWFHDNRVQGWTTRTMHNAVQGGHLDIVKWLHENRSEGCSELATCEAARLGHLDVLRWLLEHYPYKHRYNLMEFAAWEGHLDVVRHLDENTDQRASRWGVATAARRGWLQAQLVLLEHNHDLDWTNLDVVGRAFDKTLTQLSCQHADPDSPLWAETLETLERFHSNGFFSCLSLMLERALRRGYLSLAQRFIRHRDASERRKYVEVAAERRNIVLLRWMLEKWYKDLHVCCHRSW